MLKALVRGYTDRALREVLPKDSDVVRYEKALKAFIERDAIRSQHRAGYDDFCDTIPCEFTDDTKWVVLHETDSGVYYFYVDEDEQYIGDGWHLTLDEAKAQARFEYNIEESDWIDVGNIERLL